MYVCLCGWIITPAAVGEKYDSSKMEATVVVGDEDDVVLSVEKKGYMIGTRRIVRPAEVTISLTENTKKKREEEDNGEGDSTEEDAQVEV